MDDLISLPNEPEKIQTPVPESPSIPLAEPTFVSPVSPVAPEPVIVFPSLQSPEPTVTPPPVSDPPPMAAPQPFIIPPPVAPIIPPSNVVLPPPLAEVPVPVPPPVETAPPVQASPPKVKGKKEPVLFYILASVLIIAGLAFAAYNFYQAKLIQTKPNLTPTSIPKPTVGVPTPTPDVTVNWKTYKNNKNGFSFKYPNLFTYATETPNLLGVYIAPSEGTGEGKGTPFGLDLKKDSWISASATLLDKAGLLQWNTKLASMEATLVADGITVYKGKGEDLSTQASEPVFGYTGYLLKDNILYKLELNSASKEVAQASNNEKIFGQMLSTFKFVSAPTPTLKAGVSNLKTYNYNKVMFNYPSDWDLQPQILSGSGVIQEFKDKAGIYAFTLEIRGNYNNGTGLPYKDLNEFINMPYELKKLTVGGQAAVQALPRAGNESIDQVYFFSKDTKNIVSLKLETPIDGSKITEGTKIFDQILTSFKFNN